MNIIPSIFIGPGFSNIQSAITKRNKEGNDIIDDCKRDEGQGFDKIGHQRFPGGGCWAVIHEFLHQAAAPKKVFAAIQKANNHRVFFVIIEPIAQ